jgi:hypothetical protein
LNRLSGLHPFGRNWVAATILSTSIFGASSIVSKVFLGPGLISLAVAVLVGGAGFLGVLWKRRQSVIYGRLLPLVGSTH